ncbi:FG-GAP repeat domain-containing protein [Streptomyces brasiliscabiei]|uniref:FG-GAP repeat domain-containing protein n=1 Tax=Streptomyces brasiliscabiei TaxID=2736302 RepID=UPI001C1115D2|nr:FG-GAP and VCBS repeat-containing protein [Streptomyces brasiliscabiei]
MRRLTRVSRWCLALTVVLPAAACSGAGERPAAGGSGASGTGERYPASLQGERPGAGRPSAHPRPGDVNGDGYDDFAAVVAGGSLVVVYGSATGLDPRRHTVVPWSAPATGPEQTRLFRLDLDHDGFTDLVSAPQRGEPAVLWGGARGVGDAQPLTGAPASPVATGDFDGDGNADLFLPGGAEGPLGTVWFGPVRRGGAPARVQEQAGDGRPNSVPYHFLAGDFDGDRATDLAVRYHWSDPESEGDGEVALADLLYLRGGPQGLRPEEDRERPVTGLEGQPGDVDGDGVDDLYTASFVAFRKQLSVGYWLSTRSGPESGEHGGLSTDAPPGLRNETQYGGMGGTALGDVTGDGRADLVTSATGANNSDGVVWLVPDLRAATAGTVRAVTLDSPGLPGSDTPAAGRGPSRNGITVVGPLLDTDGDEHLDVVVGAPGFLNAKKQELDAFWVLRGTGAGMTYQQHFTTEDLS